MTFPWLCPFCGRSTTITEACFQSTDVPLSKSNKHGSQILRANFTVCPDPTCAEFKLEMFLFDGKFSGGYWHSVGPHTRSWALIPQSNARAFPEYVPAVVRRDYEEACSICELSPKASATLSRRCLQGIIRDFWGASGRTLAAEIDSIEDKLAPEIWESIHAVREIGNIGAHMEKDINLIVDVEPDEALQLIQLIEVLIDDWYIQRNSRQLQLAAIKKTAQDKKSSRSPLL